MTHIEALSLDITTYAWTVFCAYWLYASIKAKRAVKKESRLSRLSYLLLLFAAFGLVYWKGMPINALNTSFFDPNDIRAYTGMGISAFGIAFAIAARAWLGSNWSGSVTIKQDHELIQNGPYRYTRHPIYTGVFFGLLGAALIQSGIKDLIGVILLFIAFNIKITIEEKFLSGVFPRYGDYKRTTRKIIPFVY